jgi:putative glutamine amidotransferase
MTDSEPPKTNPLSLAKSDAPAADADTAALEAAASVETAAPVEAATAEAAAPAQAAAPLPPPTAYPLPNNSPLLRTGTEDPPLWTQAWDIFSARMRTLSDRVSRKLIYRTLKIGVSARIFHPEAGGKGLQTKTLQYLEESIAQWVMSRNVLVMMIPTVNAGGMLHMSDIRLRDYARNLDGLLLQGGADVSPHTYAESATRPEWNGDRSRDIYELELLHEFIEAGKPVLGICRGCQLINVAFGGTLYQDIATEVPHAIEHVNETYDRNFHRIRFVQDSMLSGLFANQGSPMVNSIHHQAVRTLGRDIQVEAVSGPDNIVEAIRHQKSRFVMGLQWHPEFHRASGPELLDCTPVLDKFLLAARETRF